MLFLNPLHYFCVDNFFDAYHLVRPVAKYSFSIPWFDLY